MAETEDSAPVFLMRNHRSALIVAHPGHELRVHGWLEVAQPIVFVLTDGSGHTGESRLESTTRVIGGAGARPGPVYGRFTDKAFYEAVLEQDLGRFTALAQELADTLVKEEITCVAGDAAEGYNPTHDVCRLLIDAAVRAASSSNTGITSYEFPLVGLPGALRDTGSEAHTIRLQLSDEALDRKLEAARTYEELRAEVDAALQAWGPDAFRTEWLSVARSGPGIAGGAAPFYETHGENRVREQIYEKVIRYSEHVAPLAAALGRHACAART